MEDKRKVQTAVLGRPGSQEPIVMPMDHVQARLFKLVYEGSRFFCGSFLGGCEGELITKIGVGKRVAHFAHLPEAGGRQTACNRKETGLESADHLYLGRGLPRWLKRDGGVRYRGSIPRHGGVCDGLTVELESGLLVVALTDAVTGGHAGWEEEDRRLTKTYGHVEWLFGMGTSLHEHMMKRRGHAFRVQCQDDARNIRIGTQSGPRPGDIQWSSLDQCAYRGDSLWTPHVERARTAHVGHRREKTAAEPTVVRRTSASPYQEIKEILQELDALTPRQENLEAADRLIERAWSAHEKIQSVGNRDSLRKFIEAREDKFTRQHRTKEELSRLQHELAERNRQELERRERERAKLRQKAAEARHVYEQVIDDVDERQAAYTKWRTRLNDARSRLAGGDRQWANEELAESSALEFRRALRLLEVQKTYDKGTRTLIAQASNAWEMLAEDKGSSWAVLDAHIQRLTRLSPTAKGQEASQQKESRRSAAELSQPYGEQFALLRTRLDELRAISGSTPTPYATALQLVTQAWDAFTRLAEEERVEPLRIMSSYEHWLSRFPSPDEAATEAVALKGLSDLRMNLQRKTFWSAASLFPRTLREIHRLPFDDRRNELADQAWQLENQLSERVPQALLAWKELLHVLRVLDASGWLSRVEQAAESTRDVLWSHTAAAVARLSEGSGKESAQRRLQRLRSPI